MLSRYFVTGIVCLSLAAQAGAETLTNAQIVRLSEVGLGDEVLVAKIRASGSSFDTSTDALLALKKKGVSNKVIAAMIGAGPEARSAPPASPAYSGGAPAEEDSPDPAVPHPPGIYLLADWTSPTRMLALEPVTSERTKSGNLIAYVLTGGLAKRSRKAVIAQARAGIRTPRPRPMFYFFFGEGPAPGGGRGAFWDADSAVSPADFALVRFESEDGARKAKVGSTNIWGSTSGVSDKDRIPFTHARVAPGVYAVSPEEELEEGEYGFLSPLSGGEDGRSPRVRIFDFSVGG